MSKEKPQEAYLRYLKLLSAFEGHSKGVSLDIGEQQLLNAIAIKVKAGEQIMIGDITAMRELASPATLHSRLKSLRAKK